jgi:AcrR family transcriptional regulator
MAAMPARSSRALAARLRGAEPVLPSERGLQRRSKRLVQPQGTPQEQMSELQRARLLAAAVDVFDELGYARATVGHITMRARVSRRTFYDLYGGREECLLAVVEEAVEGIRGELAEVGLDGLGWRERVRMGLWVILSYLDREPALARVCVVQAPPTGPMVLEYRERVLERLAAVVDGGRREGARGAECSALTAEGVVGAALAIVYRRLLLRERAPLTELLGELMGMVVLPYLGPAAARRERERPLPVAPVLAPAPAAAPERGAHDPLEGVPMRLTYRTARVLAAVAARGGDARGPSNSEVARAAGIVDPGQISKLLARLERLGLLVNRGAGGHAKGEPNEWSLTPLGSRVAARSGLEGLRREAA